MVSAVLKFTACERDSSSRASLHRKAERTVQHRFGHREGQGWAGSQTVGPLSHEPIQLIGGNHTIDEPELGSLLGVDDVRKRPTPWRDEDR